MTDQPKKRRAVVSVPKESRKKQRRAKPENSDSDEPTVIPPPPSPAPPRSTQATAPDPAPAGPTLAARLAARGPAPVVTTYSPCIRCVKKWTEDDSTICHRDAALGKCRSCSRAGTECSLLPPHFHGAFSAAQKLTGRARRRACAGIRAALEAYEGKNDEGSSVRESAGSSAQERGEMLHAIRSLNRNVFRLMNTIREVRGLELVSDEEI